jgi:hypothetical protein
VTPWPHSAAFPLALLGSIAAIVGFDAIAAWLNRARPAVYRKLWPVQFGIYVAIGFVTMYATLDLRAVQVIGAIAAFVEATLGWAITWRLGPGRVANANALNIVVVIASMTAFGFGFAMVGALIFNAAVALVFRLHA